MKTCLYISSHYGDGRNFALSIKAAVSRHFGQGYDINPFEIGMHLEKLHDLCGHKRQLGKLHGLVYWAAFV